MQRFKPYLKYLKPYRGRLVTAFLCLALYGAANGVGLPALLKYVLKPIFGEDRGLPLRDLLALVALVPALFLTRGLSAYAAGYLFQQIGTGVLEEIRAAFFRKLQVLPLSFIQSHRVGELTSRAVTDAQLLQSAITAAASEGIKHPLSLVGAIGFVIYQAWNTDGVVPALLCLAFIPLCVFPIRYAARKVLRRAHQAQAELGSISAQIAENISAAREVRAFGLEDRSVERFRTSGRALLRAQLKIAKYSLGLNPVIEFLSAVGIAGTLVYAYRTGVPSEVLFSVIAALFVCYEPVKKLGYLNSELKRGVAALDRLEPILHEPERIADPAQPVAVDRLQGRIEFRDVAFSYGVAAPVLRGVNVVIPAGTACALVGPSGAGKTTFANLVPRFFEVAGGSVSIDGHDVRSLRLADLRRNIAVVSQEPVLFNDTIRNNLLLGRADATPEQIEQAAKDAHAHEFIVTLPQGYDTMVGERGASLSGGQKQRIAIARAFLRNAPILILDEVTSALDSQSEQAIQLALRELMAGKTVLIIAHRFSTIRDANLILVFDKETGGIVAQGPHASVYASSPLYRQLYDGQQIN